MSFDANVYQQLAAVSPEAAQQYLAAETQQAPAAPAPVQAPTFQPPQAQSQFTPAAPSAPAPELARGTFDDFFSQPSASNGGKGATSYFRGKAGPLRPKGSWIQFTVDRDITNADVSQMTKFGTNVPETWQYGPMAGKPKFQLIIPATVVASGDNQHGQVFENGAVKLYLKPGVVTDSFRAALAAAGEPSGLPKAGSVITMIMGDEKPNKSGNPTQLYDFQYQAPQSVPTAPAEAPAPAAPVAAPVPSAPAAPAPAASDAKAALLAQLQGN